MSEPYSAEPPNGYSPDRAGNWADIPFAPPPERQYPDLERCIESLKREHRRMKTRHALRESGQSLAWVMKQPVLDQTRDLLNAVLRGYDRFQGIADGTIGILIDRWPGLRDRLEAADFSDHPLMMGTRFTGSLRTAVLLDLVTTLWIPVREAALPAGATPPGPDIPTWPGGLTPSEVETWRTAVHGEAGADGNAQPVLTVTSGVDVLEAPFEPDDLPGILDWLEGLCLDHTVINENLSRFLP